MDAKVQELIQNIEKASRGEELRTAIVDALQYYTDHPEVMIRHVTT